ncbi:MAG: hypothetical protein ACK53W_13385 [Gemmatimonadota bacterium]
MLNADVEQALRGLERPDGRIVPAEVVDAARDPTSPLHGHFEWDDTVAAERHRLDQARQLIRQSMLHVTVREVPLTVPRYIRDPDATAREAGYIATMRARSDEDIARAAIVAEMQRVAQAARRAKALAAVLGVAADIDAIDDLAAGVTTRVQATNIPTGAEAQ